VRWVTVISMDSFYRGLSVEERADAHNYDFDHPSAIDFTKLIDVLTDLRQGKRTSVPIYDFVTHSRLNHSTTVYGADVIIIEGILLLYDEQLRGLLDMKIFVDTPADTRLARRLRRDTKERGRTTESILEQYERFVKPAYDEFVHPTKDFAHLVIPYGNSNAVAIDVVSGHVIAKLQERGYVASDPRADLANFEEQTMPSNVFIMKATNQSNALHTIIRDQKTSRDDFCFYADRLSRMAVEFALSSLPVTPKTVVAPTGASYDGCTPVGNICSVSIMRGGEGMERAVREVLSGVRIGKILIQSFEKKPRLFYCKLPKDIDERAVLLLDPTLATGAALKMAIRVLLDHGVLPEDIYVVTLVASLPGLHSVSYAHPSVKIFATAVDEVDDNFYCSPGVGNFGMRYFGDGDSF
ncbi:MAG: uridine kinase, partial [archaeon]|nr:uridine kinase [archaeon]